MITDIVTVEYMRGPLDGLVQRQPVKYPPGELIRVGVPSCKGKFQHVYAATSFVDVDEVLRLYHVQILPRGEDVYE